MCGACVSFEIYYFYISDTFLTTKNIMQGCPFRFGMDLPHLLVAFS